MIEICFGRLQINGSGEGINCSFKVTLSIKTDSFVVVSVSILRLYFCGQSIISYSLLEFSKLVISKTSVKQCFEVSWLDYYSFRIEVNSLLIITSLPCCVSKSMTLFSFHTLSLTYLLGWNSLSRDYACSHLGRAIHLSERLLLALRSSNSQLSYSPIESFFFIARFVKSLLT